MAALQRYKHTKLENKIQRDIDNQPDAVTRWLYNCEIRSDTYCQSPITQNINIKVLASGSQKVWISNGSSSIAAEINIVQCRYTYTLHLGTRTNQRRT